MHRAPSINRFGAIYALFLVLIFLSGCGHRVGTPAGGDEEAKVSGDELLAIWQDQTRADSVRYPALLQWASQHRSADTALRRSLQVADEAAKKQLPSVELQALVIASRSAQRKDSLLLAEAFAKKAVSLAYVLGRNKGIGDAAHQRASVWDQHGRKDSARTWYQKAAKSFELSGKRSSMASSLAHIGWSYGDEQNYQASIDPYAKSLHIYRDLMDSANMAQLEVSLGIAYLNLGDYHTALVHFEQSVNIAMALGNIERACYNYCNIGLIYDNQSDYPAALRCYKKAAAMVDSTHGRPWSYALNSMGMMYYKLGYYDSAHEVYKKAMDVRRQIGSASAISITNNDWGMVYAATGDFDKAEELYQAAMRNRKERNDRWGITITNINLAMLEVLRADKRRAKGASLAEVRPQYERALALLNQSRETAVRMKLLKWVIASADKLSEVHARLGNHKDAYYFKDIERHLSDSLHTEKTSQRLAQMEYEAERRELERKQAEIDKIAKQQLAKRKEQWSLLLAGGFLLLLAVVILLLRHRLLRRKNSALQMASQRADDLLLNILPAETAKELKELGRSSARRYNSASVMFIDLKPPLLVGVSTPDHNWVTQLGEQIKQLDTLCEQFGIEKIKTMGSQYMCACGLPIEREDHAQRLAAFGLAVLTSRQGESWYPRLGMHSGSLVAGIVGTKKFAYDIWGDTVNIASRIQTAGDYGKLNVSDAAWQLIKDSFNGLPRGKLEVKNAGFIDMYFVESVKDVAIAE